MTQDSDLTGRARKAIKFGICLLLIGQIMANAYLFYVHEKLAPIVTDPRTCMLLIPACVYVMVTRVPDILKRSAGIRRQAIHLADWWLAFGIWQFLAAMGEGPLIALFVIGAAIMALSVKDAILLEA